MADTRGTWSLSEAWAEKTANEWVGLPSVWLTPEEQRTDTCYWVAGVQNNTPTSNTVDKTNIPANTTAQVPGLNNVMPGHWKGGHSSGTAGYSAGGRDPQQSKIGKITYATDAGEILSSYLTAARGYVPIGFCNDTFGWFLGGGEPGTPWPVAVSKVDKMTFATEAVALLPSTQLHANLNNTTTSGNTTKGYYAGGQGPTSKIAKIEYSSDTNTLIPSTIPIAMYRGSGTTNGDGTIGYYIGGSVIPGMSYTSNCTKHVYATDTISSITPGRQYNPRGLGAGSGNQTYALSAGGYYYPPAADYSSIDRMTYSNETSSRQPGLDMSVTRRRQGAHGARTYGRGATYDADKTRWFDGSEQSGYGVEFDGSNDWLEAADSDDYSFGTGDYTIEFWVNPEGSISNKGYVCKWKTSGNLEWFVGTNGTTLVFAYSTDGNTYTIPSSGYTMQSGVWQHIAVTRDSGDIKIFVDGVQKGSTHDDSSADYHTGSDPLQIMANEHGDGSWRADGKISNVRIVKGQALYTSNFTSTTESLTDTSQGATASNVKIICCNSSTVTGSTKTSSTISVGGGTPDLITQTKVTPRPPAETPTASKSGLPTPSPNDGYYGGGSISGVGYYSKFDKISYASDTTSALPASDASYSGGVYAQASTSSPTEGWSNDDNDLYTLTYSTSTQSNSPSATLTFNPTGACSGFGYIPKGFICGGYSGGPISTMSQITYATSTVASAPNFAYAGYYKGSGTGNQTAGYLAGAVPGTTNAGKYVYATSTSTALPGKLSQARSESGGTGNSTNGYFSGCGSNSHGTRTDRVVFSTDTFTYVPGANLLKAVDGVAANSSSTAGYLNGGSNPSNTQGTSDVDKLTYSNETMSSLPSSADTAQQRMSFMGFSARQYANGDTYAVSTPNVI